MAGFSISPASRMPELKGTVLQALGGAFEVLLDSGPVVTTFMRGRIKQETRLGDRVVAGDRVRVAQHADGTHTIDVVEPRRSQLARRAPGRGTHRAKVLVANADQVVIVLAAAHPEPRLGMLDRLLVLAESNEIPALIVVNKVDLVERAHVEQRFAPYAAAGYPVLFTSTVTGVQLEELRRRLCGKESVLTGPSGAGKSSLLNAIEPGLDLRVGDVSEAVNKGRHTTVSARLIPLPCGGFVADTPGLREVGLWDVDPDQLDRLFPEFAPLLGACRFGTSCTHTHEPDCAVREAAERGDISRQRYDSYVKLLAE
jgi:ribosome biogenesis GTPase